MKKADVDFVGGREGQSRQLKDPFCGMTGIVEPPLYLNFSRLLELYQTSEVYYRAVQVKSQFTVGQGWRLVAFGDADPEDVKKLESFFSKCNPDFSFDEVLHQVMVDLECLGNAYLEVTREPSGSLTGLYHVPAHTVRVASDGGFVQLRGAKKMKFSRFGETGAVDEEGMPLSEMIHLAKYNPASTYYGLPDSVPAIGSTMGDLMARDFNINFFDNNASPQYCLIISGGMLTPKDKEDLQEYFSNLKGNPHKTMILQLPKDVTGDLKPISTSPKEASFAEFRKTNRDLMVVAHGVPPHLLGIIESGNLGGGTGETQLANFKSLVISPRQRFLSERITRLIIKKGFGIDNVRFEFNEMDAEDEMRNAQIQKLFIDAGVMTAQEVRRSIGLMPLEE
ncbi:MAG: phage portal protein [Caldisericia bacterium]|nr:phage portal protein [Caldisericia bacterium]